MCEDIGFELQDSIAKLSQLALAQEGSDSISETAQAWPSLLQYGLGTLQQLDLAERGATDRLAIWGIQRYLDFARIGLRDGALITYLRRNGAVLRASLDEDERVPALCARRVLNELRLY